MHVGATYQHQSSGLATYGCDGDIIKNPSFRAREGRFHSESKGVLLFLRQRLTIWTTHCVKTLDVAVNWITLNRRHGYCFCIHDYEKDKETTAKLSGETYSPVISEEYRWTTWAAPKTVEGKSDFVPRLQAMT